jgi:hypothetical protein
MTATPLRNNMIMVFKQELHPPELAELLPFEAYYLAERMLADDWPDDPSNVILSVLLMSRGYGWVSRGMRPVGAGDVIAIRGVPYILTSSLIGIAIQGHSTLKYKEHARWLTRMMQSGSIQYSH